MEHAFIGASSSHSWLRCSLSPWLSYLANNEIPEAELEEYTQEGIDAHKFLETTVLSQRTNDSEEADQDIVKHVFRSLDYFLAHIGLGEDDLGAIKSEQRYDFSHVVPGGFGTCDLLYYDPETRTLYVADLKYGEGVSVDADHNPQGLLYLAGAYEEWSMFDQIDRLELVILQPRMDNFSTFAISADRLQAWCDFVARPAALDVVNNPTANPTVEGCQFCSGAGLCTALEGYATSDIVPFEYPSIEQARELVDPDTLTPEQLGAFLSKRTLLNKFTKRAEERGRELLTLGERVPGVKLVEGKNVRAWRDEKKASSALGRAGISAGDRFTKKLISPAQAEKTIGKDHAVLKNHVVTVRGAPRIVPESAKGDPAVISREEVLEHFDDES